MKKGQLSPLLPSPWATGLNNSGRPPHLKSRQTEKAVSLEQVWELPFNPAPLTFSSASLHPFLLLCMM